MGTKAQNSRPVTQPHNPNKHEQSAGKTSFEAAGLLLLETVIAGALDGINGKLSAGFGLCGSLTGLPHLATSLSPATSGLFFRRGLAETLLLRPDKY